jgi:hypothetical protein
VFNNSSPDPRPDRLPDVLDLRRDLAGSVSTREDATSWIVRHVLQAQEYGHFLANSQPLLQKWRSKLNELMADWEREQMNYSGLGIEDRYVIYYPRYKFYTARGVFEYLTLLQEMYNQL